MIGQIMANLIVLIILVIVVVIVTGNEFSDTRDAKIYQILKKLNKPFLKSIKSPDGDIIDCVHMKNHPIYDHPLFKNYTIQMRPSSYPKGWKNKFLDPNKENMVTQLWTINGKCPKNSIPIRRTRKKNILQAESIEKYGRKDPNNISLPTSTISNSTNIKHEYATMEVKVSSRAKLHGTKANINVWKPYVQTPREFSLAQIWMCSGRTRNRFNTIEVGWQVYPYLYNDSNPRYFVYWTADGYRRTGCYNLYCAGFVATNRRFALGAAIPQVSTFNGTQEQIPTYIWKDSRTGNWWLAFHTTIVGYWPSSLFTSLKSGATIVTWGGEILNSQEHSQHTSTRMGSGLFAEEGKQKASYFSNIKIIDNRGITKPPMNHYSRTTNPNCYNLKSGIHHISGVYFFYGGPGRNSNCN